MISYAAVPIGTGATMGCAQCATLATGAARPLAEVNNDLEAAAAAAQGVAFVGFEAFAHPALPQLIGAARSVGYDRIRISTDGRSLDHGGNAVGAFSAGVTHLELLLLAGDSATNDRLAGRPGLTESAMTGAGMFMAAAGRKALVSGLVPLCRHSAPHAASAVAALGEAGAVAVEFDATCLKSSPANEMLLRAALETATVNRLAAWVTGWSGVLEVAYSTAPWRMVEAGT